MNLFELISGSTLTTSIAFCFVFQRRDAPALAFAVGFGVVGCLILGAMVVHPLVSFFRRAHPPPKIAAPSVRPARFSLTTFIVAVACFIAAASTLWTLPLLPGIAALAALLSAVSGSGRRQTHSFLLLGAVVFISIIAHIYYRLHSTA
jgi:hypothetical protein